MKKPLVSIITPIYNGENYLAHSILSALNQTYTNFELILVNDGSTDQSKTIAKGYLKDSRIHYIEQKNAGVAAARNTAIKTAKGKYIAFLDQDDIWFQNKLEIQVSAIEQDNSLAFVYSKQNIINSQGEKIQFNWPTGASGNCFEELFVRNKTTILTVLLRKSILDEIGLFNEQLSGTDDYEMWLRITLKHPIHFIDQALASYRTHDSNVSNDDFKMTVRDLQTINTVLLQHPEVYKIIDNTIIKSRLYELNNQLGGWYAWKKKNFLKARFHYRQAIINKPTIVRPYYRWIYCALTDHQRKSLNWYVKRFKIFFHSQ
ncbi:MAG: glycosyltransferase [Methylomarinum sp.]|nr:glycosyltransferase [Methylomarinum sp.]